MNSGENPAYFQYEALEQFEGLEREFRSRLSPDEAERFSIENMSVKSMIEYSRNLAFYICSVA